MKKITFLVIVLISFNCKSQDIIEINKLTVNGVNILGKDKSLLISNLGEPSEIIYSDSEMDEEDMYEYRYLGLKIYVINNFVESFEITKNNYLLTINNIRIGSNISSIKNIYPNNYKFRNSDYLKLDIEDSDMFLTIEFSPTSNNISKINIGNY
jgi:hypothetical protein